MATTVKQLVRAGAVGTICLKYYQLRGKKDRWERVEQWARSEFSDASQQTIRAVIERCKRSARLADRINRSPKRKEITGQEERALRGG